MPTQVKFCCRPTFLLGGTSFIATLDNRWTGHFCQARLKHDPSVARLHPYPHLTGLKESSMSSKDLLSIPMLSSAAPTLLSMHIQTKTTKRGGQASIEMFRQIEPDLGSSYTDLGDISFALALVDIPLSINVDRVACQHCHVDLK